MWSDIRFIGLVLAISMFSCGCATILNGERAEFEVTSNVQGATIFANGEAVGTTSADRPVTVKIPRQSQTVEVRHPDYNPASIQVNANLEGEWIVLDILLTGMIGLIVDAVTGAWNGVYPTRWDAELEFIGPPAPSAQ